MRDFSIQVVCFGSWGNTLGWKTIAEQLQSAKDAYRLPSLTFHKSLTKLNHVVLITFITHPTVLPGYFIKAKIRFTYQSFCDIVFWLYIFQVTSQLWKQNTILTKGNAYFSLCSKLPRSRQLCPFPNGPLQHLSTTNNTVPVITVELRQIWTHCSTTPSCIHTYWHFYKVKSMYYFKYWFPCNGLIIIHLGY